MDTAPDGYILAGTLAEIAAKGRVVVKGRRCPILVVHEGGRLHALDNRCPHMGFPLHRGSLADGILTCHWHHARFDLASGGAFDPWADDVPKVDVRVADGRVWVAPDCAIADAARHWRRRLADGLEHDLGLVVAKAVLGALDAGLSPKDLVADAVLFGARARDGFASGLATLTAMANVLPELPEEERFLALYQGIRSVAADCDGEPPRRRRRPLADAGLAADQLERWLRHWTRVRHREGAERTLLSAVAAGLRPARLAGMLLAACTERAYADEGHALDFVNKAFEVLDIIGWEHAADVLPTVVAETVAARGGEETNAWRTPEDLVGLLDDAARELPAPAAAARGRFSDHAALACGLLADDPRTIVAALGEAVRAGAAPADLGRALAYAAAVRLAKFGTSNEVSDWDTAHHVFTHCNALHRLLRRAEGDGAAVSWERVRGVYQGALALYLTRYLNVPPAGIPGEAGDRLDDLPADAGTLTAALLDSFDRQSQVEPAARLVARYLALGHPAQGLIATLARALLREDAGFHAFQAFEAGVCQFREWGDGREGRHVLIAVARFLAAHSPTERSRYQTADIARRLFRGGALHGEGEEAATAPG
jgi:nitrite reductase/ring-hydroxylating ferredoxin subunit